MSESKRDLYRRQSEEARATLAALPEWMRRNLEPPTVTVPAPTYDPCGGDRYSHCRTCCNDPSGPPCPGDCMW